MAHACHWLVFRKCLSRTSAGIPATSWTCIVGLSLGHFKTFWHTVSFMLLRSPTIHITV